MANGKVEGMRVLFKSQAGQMEAVANAKSFPIGKVIEEILNEEEIKFQNFSVKGGFDVRLTRGFEVKLPLKNRSGGEISLDYLAGKVTERYYSRYAPGVIQNRPDLTAPSTLTKSYASWIVSSPQEESNEYAFLDVGAIKVLPKSGKKSSKTIFNLFKILSSKN